MSDTSDTSDLPEAAGRRLRSTAFSSGLSVPELAACAHLGMRPVGLVQGFCVMGWNWWYGGYNTGVGSGLRYLTGRTLTTYQCPHPIINTTEHRSYGANYECTEMQLAWGEGYNAAYRRMIEEASETGAHGVIGVVDATRALIDSNVREFHLLGTAIVLDGAPPPRSIWSTYLAGQRLGKLFEAGLSPVTVTAALGAVAINPVCVTEYLESGRYDPLGIVPPEGEIAQMSDAHQAARRLARDHLKSRLEGDSLQGATMEIIPERVGMESICCVLRGTRVTRVHDVDPLPAPVPTVRLS